MRDTKDMLRRTMPNYRDMLTGAMLLLTTAGCGWDAALQGHDFTPSDYAIQHGYPDLQPASAFRIADYEVPDSTNLISRFAILKRKIAALHGPVLSSNDRARLEAAVERTASTQG